MAERAVVNVKYILWYLLGGTRGGEMRVKILSELRKRPYNTNQLTELLGVDYNTIKYHLKLLSGNQLITSQEKRYGTLYFISPLLEANMGTFEEILNKSGIKYKSREGKK